jgi:hypothetical protein
MAYEKHPCFDTDGLETTKLWRYIDLAKLLDILRTSSLFFPSLSSLAKLDYREGMYTDADRKIWQMPFAIFSEIDPKYQRMLHARTPEEWDRRRKMELQHIDQAQLSRGQFAVSCWHSGDHEDFAMWKIYAHERSGVCIQSDFERLTYSFDGHCDDSIYAGRVNYRDYTSDGIGTWNAFNVVMSKRREFSYEKEVRAVVNRLRTFGGEDGKKYFDPVADTVQRGLRIAVNVDALIDKIFISPYADDYVIEAVVDVLRRYGVSKAVQKSEI